MRPVLLLFALAACGGAPHFVSSTATPVGAAPRHEVAPVSATSRPSASAINPAAPDRPPRQRALLVQEIQGLEELLHSTPPTARELPFLLHRIAHDYAELAAALGDDPSAANAHDKAADTYSQLVSRYPDYARREEVLYALAYEYQTRGHLEEARAVYQKLFQSAKWAPVAHLEIGEMAFDAARWSEAEHEYAEALKTPPPDNWGYGYAWYKLAYVYWNEGDGPKCIDAFKQAIDYGTRFSQLPKAAKIAEVAQRGLVTASEQLGSGSQLQDAVVDPRVP